MQLCREYSEYDRNVAGSDYHIALEALRQHHDECAQCHGRTIELTEIAERTTL